MGLPGGVGIRVRVVPEDWEESSFGGMGTTGTSPSGAQPRIARIIEVAPGGNPNAYRVRYEDGAEEIVSAHRVAMPHPPAGPLG